jgi:hypothetical protein
VRTNGEEKRKEKKNLNETPKQESNTGNRKD